MDANRVDRLARALTSSPPRRAVLGLIFGAMLSINDLEGADARKKRKKRCRAGKKKCGKRCIPKSNCCRDTDCPSGSGQTCQGGTCACPPGEEDSGGVCGTRPDCLGRNATCENAGDCCSGFCPLSEQCGCSIEGNQCLDDDDCCPGELTCVGFVCTE
jgi:hypothetical protein